MNRCNFLDVFTDKKDDSLFQLFDFWNGLDSFTRKNDDKVNHYKTEKNEVFEIVATGRKKEDISISTKDNDGISYLTIKMNQRESSGTSDKEKTLRDFYLKKENYSFSIDRNADADKANASLEDGILTITIPLSKVLPRNEKSIHID